VSLVVVIDGASSSGRTSLVNRFCERVPDAYCKAHIDAFVTQLPPATWEACGSTDEGWATIGRAFNEHLLALSRQHERVIADAFYKLPGARQHLLATFRRQALFLVQLYCELDELERRERQRGDRRPGLARSQFGAVYSFTGHDLRIDSTHRSVDACADQLVAALGGRMSTTGKGGEP